MEVAVKDKLYESLQHFFGYDSFKENQEAVVKSVLQRRDTLVIMPTGGGKSLCFQLPAMMSEGTAIIVSPLIALMKNQVDLIRAHSSFDSVAHFLNSSLNRTQIKTVRQDIFDQKTKLLYVAPETLTKQENIDFFKEVNVSFVGVDEAHCISEWGHDFRPEYRKIRQMIDAIDSDMPIIALTATATPKVQSDIVKNLELKDLNTFISSFNRPNLYYEVRSKGNKEQTNKSIIKFIKNNSGKSGIIYCLSRKSTEEVADVLKVNDIKATAYHAGLDAATRTKRQDQFLMEEVQVIVATIAFGMGIDKPDVRFVIHYNVPRSLEGYYQETGRAGRDGLEGKCIAYYNYSDIIRLEKFLRDKSVSEREIGIQLLLETSAYAETSSCRRKYLLHYFGERYLNDNCENCDNCINPKEKFEGQTHIQLAIRTIEAVKEKFEINYIIEVILGKKSQRVISYDHHTLEIFGEGKEQDENFWNTVLRKALLDELLEKEIENYGLLRITKKGREFLENPYSIKLSRNHNYDIIIEEDSSPQSSALDPTLLNMLKDLTKKLAKELNLPPFVIFQDFSLEDMATQYPINLSELSQITGISTGKAGKYGSKFVKLISKYVEENEIERPNDLVIKSVVKKSGLKVYIIQSIDKKIPFHDIARSRDIELDGLLNEIENIVNSGTKVSIDYYVEEVLDDDQQSIIYDYFRTASTDSLQKAAQNLKSYNFDLSEIQMVRIKFMSEMAN